MGDDDLGILVGTGGKEGGQSSSVRLLPLLWMQRKKNAMVMGILYDIMTKNEKKKKFCQKKNIKMDD